MCALLRQREHATRVRHQRADHAPAAEAEHTPRAQNRQITNEREARSTALSARLAGASDKSADERSDNLGVRVPLVRFHPRDRSSVLLVGAFPRPCIRYVGARRV